MKQTFWLMFCHCSVALMERLLVYIKGQSFEHKRSLGVLAQDRAVNVFVGRGKDRGVTDISWKEA